MILSFTLSMPGNNSWNGKWSGQDNFYAIVKHFGSSKKSKEKAEKILKDGYFSYDFGDGWRAGISVKQVDSATARKIRKQSRGFCGYDWMVESILNKGYIEA